MKKLFQIIFLVPAIAFAFQTEIETKIESATVYFSPILKKNITV